LRSSFSSSSFSSSCSCWLGCRIRRHRRSTAARVDHANAREAASSFVGGLPAARERRPTIRRQQLPTQDAEAAVAVAAGAARSVAGARGAAGTVATAGSVGE
jgi:hypothetical protein